MNLEMPGWEGLCMACSIIGSPLCDPPYWVTEHVASNKVLSKA